MKNSTGAESVPGDDTLRGRPGAAGGRAPRPEKRPGGGGPEVSSGEGDRAALAPPSDEDLWRWLGEAALRAARAVDEMKVLKAGGATKEDPRLKTEKAARDINDWGVRRVARELHARGLIALVEWKDGEGRARAAEGGRRWE
jgi:hypothetical protein